MQWTQLIALIIASSWAACISAPEQNTASTKQPNVIILFIDDLGMGDVGFLGNKNIPTPHIDSLAAQGVELKMSYVTNPPCSPSRSCLVTGMFAQKFGKFGMARGLPIPEDHPTIAEFMRDAGYVTGQIGKWDLGSLDQGPHQRGFMEVAKWAPGKAYNKGGRRLKGFNNDAITDEALAWLEQKRDKTKPFCLLLHPKPPHEPYLPAPPKYKDYLSDVTIPEPATLYDDYKGRTPEAIQKTMRSNLILRKPSFKKYREEIRKQNPDITDKEMLAKLYQIYIKGYYRLVKSVDDNVGRVLDYLDESGLTNNTIVIYTADQGFSLGEHGFYNKQWMYEKPLHQPLLIRFPEVIEAGLINDSMTNHVDLAPTLLDYAGLPIPEDIQGYSLRSILEGNAEQVRDTCYYHFYSHGDDNLPEMIGIRTNSHKLIHYPGMKGKYQWELFDLVNDPEEMQNHYTNPAYQDMKAELTEGLLKLIRDLEDPVDAPNLVKTVLP